METGTLSITRVLAWAASLGGHAGIVAWLLLAPAPTVLPEQRIVDVDLVAPSLPVASQAPTAPQQAIPPSPLPEKPRPVSPKGILKTASPPPAASPPASAQPTTGEAAPEATRTVAAISHAPRLAQPLHNPAPSYPPAARRRGHEGTVLLRVDVSPSGKAEAVAILDGSGYESLDRAASEAVREWRFIPAEQDGRPVASTLRLPIVFRLED